MNYIPNVARKGAAGTLLPVRNGVGRLRTVLAAALLLLVILPASAQRIVERHGEKADARRHPAANLETNRH